MPTLNMRWGSLPPSFFFPPFLLHQCLLVIRWQSHRDIKLRQHCWNCKCFSHQNNVYPWHSIFCACFTYILFFCYKRPFQWDVREMTTKKLHTFENHSAEVYFGTFLFSLCIPITLLLVCFSPDGKRIASVSFDFTLRSRTEFHTSFTHPLLLFAVFDVERFEEVALLTGHTRNVMHCTFSHDGTRIATGSSDMTTRQRTLLEFDRQFPPISQFESLASRALVKCDC